MVFIRNCYSIRIAEQRCKELYAKQGHRDQYKTVEERDKVKSSFINFNLVCFHIFLVRQV